MSKQSTDPYTPTTCAGLAASLGAFTALPRPTTSSGFRKFLRDPQNRSSCVRRCRVIANKLRRRNDELMSTPSVTSATDLVLRLQLCCAADPQSCCGAKGNAATHFTSGAVTTKLIEYYQAAVQIYLPYCALTHPRWRPRVGLGREGHGQRCVVAIKARRGQLRMGARRCWPACWDTSIQALKGPRPVWECWNEWSIEMAKARGEQARCSVAFATEDLGLEA